LEKTPAAALSKPNDKMQPAASETTALASPSETAAAVPADKPRSWWRWSLHDIEAFFARLVRPAEPSASQTP
jgi:hypothetical protein